MHKLDYFITTNDLVSNNYVKSKRRALFRGIDLWNNLDTSCRLNMDKDNFKAQAKPLVSKLYLKKWSKSLNLPADYC